MSDDLLPFFDRELAYLREMGAEFARAHPKIAGRLRLSADAVDDPHVARLIQSIAFLNARTRKKLDDDFPELANALLGVVSPHHLAPIPSMSIVQFDCSPDMTGPYAVPKGSTLETDLAYGAVCHFTTSYDVQAWPIRIEGAALLGTPFQAPKVPQARGAASCLKLRLVTTEGQCAMGELGIERIRFFLRGQPGAVQRLYELLLDDAICVAVASSHSDRAPIVLGPECLSPVGFDRDEGLLPRTGRTQHGTVLLTEYFVFPEKFQFVELAGLPTGDPGRFGDAIELYIYSRATDRDLEQSVDEETFALGCTPVVNLYQRRADPIELDEARAEYRIVPDAREPDSHEIYSINAVAALSRDGARRDYAPFYGVQHSTEEEARECYWHADRRHPASSLVDRDPGTEMYVSLMDLEGGPSVPGEWILETHVTCLNRNRPAKLPFGGGEPRLRFSEGGGGIDEIRVLTPFTETRRIARDRGALWRLVSQLSLNHLSISEGAEALREILRVNDLADTAVTRSVVASITDVRSRPTMVRIREEGVLALCRGTEIRVVLDEDRLGAVGTYQFSTLLDRFLASYSSVNSFVQLVSTCRKEDDGMRRWPARSGTRVLI